MPERAGLAPQFASAQQRADALELGMWTFLSTEVLLFGGVILTYFVYRHADPQAFAEAGRRTDIVIGAANTAVLLTSSFCVAAAVEAARANVWRAARWLLVAAIVLGLVFLGLKGLEYASEYREHLVPGIDFVSNSPHTHGIELFFVFYFIATGLHAVHLICGIAALGIFAKWMGQPSACARRQAGLRTATLYWHFVDVVWIFLFALIYLPGRSG
ncbi:MAG: cytochrome c oxidase subunit 3 [Afipia sp.]|jgi:cytochrome c oxidase subunit 3